MSALGIGLVVLAFIGLLVYYARSALNSQRNEEALIEQNRAQADSLVLAAKLAADKEREERLREKTEIVGIDRAAANRRLSESLKDDDTN